jgi:ABC-type nickel/cobalt efflux system permease component RcnA
VADLPGELTRLIGAADLSIPAVVIALLLAALVGAFHAATPGHGKTLMAAYLVGTRGNVRHALGLGLTVTFAHTVGVFALGAIVLVAGTALPSERLLVILGLVSGVVVTGLGVVFLAQRINSARHAREDEHEHEHADGLEHSDGPIRHTHIPQPEGPLRRRNLVALGLVGGLVPSASAILILVGSIAAGRPAFGMVLTVAFGAGMAAVLVGVGVLLVRARSLVERLPSRNLARAMAFAPIVTACVFVIVGVAITVQAGAQLQ